MVLGQRKGKKEEEEEGGAKKGITDESLIEVE